MEHKWIIFAVMLWIVAILLCASFDKADITTYSTNGSTVTSTLQYLTNFKNISYTSDTAGNWTFVGVNTNYFSTIWKVLTFDFNFMQGSGYDIVRWVVFYPITIGMMFAFAQLFLQAVQGLLSAIIPG